MADLAREHCIPAVRLPREDWRTTLALAPDGPLPKMPRASFALLCRRAEIARAADSLLMTISSAHQRRRMTEAYLTGLVDRLQPASPRSTATRGSLPTRS